MKMGMAVLLLLLAFCSTSPGPTNVDPSLDDPHPKSIYLVGVEGLPLHSENTEELRGLCGPREFIEGEYLAWGYPFRWTATEINGKVIVLQPSSGVMMRFIKRVSNGWVVQIDGTRYWIVRPPGIREDRVLRLAEIKAVGKGTDIIKNRLGEPTVIKQGDAGVFALVYVKQISTTREGVDAVRSFTDGNFGRALFSSRTTTLMPYRERMTYTPYAFAVLFDEQGIARRVLDLVTRDAEWERK